MSGQSCGCASVTGVCSAMILVIMYIAQGIVGGKYIGYCPGQPFIPYYMLAMIGGIVLFCLKECNLFVFGLGSIFYFIWFIAGNVCIYTLYKSDNWNCDRTLVLFAFWSTNFTYVLLVVMFCSCAQQESDTDAQRHIPV